MSTHDSLDTVFNCLSKEAADFLVKPVRKNELKNLWQHVWRRCKSVCINVLSLLLSFPGPYQACAFIANEINVFPSALSSIATSP
jgi:DNA-binding response OmpR family regulator